LLDWAVKAGVKHFVHASTGGLYGRGPHPFKEDACIRLEGSLAFYFGSKWAAEILAAPYSGIFSVTALRFFFVYGPGQKSTMLIPRLVKSVEEGRPVALGARDGMRLNPVYVEDAAAAAVAALGLEGDTIVNVGGAEVLSIRNIVETIGALIGREPHFHQAEVTEGEDLIADISRMRSLLHSPKTSFREGVGQLIRVACE
jgi:nucleoside-diphosphate-sugar epimerase